MREYYFISHASADRETAEELVDLLESRGFACWIAPRDIQPGSVWAGAILSAIENSRAVIILRSSDSDVSGHVRRERIQAEELKKSIIDLVLPGNDPDPSSSAVAVLQCEGVIGETCSELIDELEGIRDVRSLFRRVSPFWLLLALPPVLLFLLSASHRDDITPQWPEDMVFAEIPSGSFLMGAPENEDGSTDAERPVHEVSLPGFQMMTTEVTQGMWKEVMGESQEELFQRVLEDEPGSPRPELGRDHPICYVTWNEACEFIRHVQQMDPAHAYSLPTEAEWEYACRAGRRESVYSEPIDSIAWHQGNSGGSLHPVAMKDANDWGLYDMLGNVSEWCLDPWHGDYTGAPCDGSEWTEGGSQYMVWRGGGYINAPHICRSAFRDRRRSDFRQCARGFRLIRRPTD